MWSNSHPARLHRFCIQIYKIFSHYWRNVIGCDEVKQLFDQCQLSCCGWFTSILDLFTILGELSVCSGAERFLGHTGIIMRHQSACMVLFSITKVINSQIAHLWLDQSWAKLWTSSFGPTAYVRVSGWHDVVLAGGRNVGWRWLLTLDPRMWKLGQTLDLHSKLPPVGQNYVGPKIASNFGRMYL